jgi:hypothetical protein
MGGNDEMKIRTHNIWLYTMLNHHVSQNLKLIGIDEFNNLIYILTQNEPSKSSQTSTCITKV